ncbi:hypothetical protein AMATHDRAFT_149748 [Amanita thiersii Skay4041]|uniref:NAD-dependent epimerase/dehydratase domain-containing protein n=1 Tax=Amanita thiersii Skay4041 TaxID=703135 RepID=A0A2A9NLF9_9AGAR|nr:hypothetical protein AMATHDRAFT_149748 [Amanita thiersii Skay4041]
MQQHEVILITGAAGFLGQLLAKELTRTSDEITLILVDIVQPQLPDGRKGRALAMDLTDPGTVDRLFNTLENGVPDTVYCLHGLMSRGSEDNFDLALKVNIDSVRHLLEATRRHRPSSNQPAKFIFASSLAVYGGLLPDVIMPTTLATPEGTYGFSKLASELFINEFTRRGFVDGRIVRLPTVVVRPGAPSAATSSFMSGVIREPLKGIESVCPIGNSLDSLELDLAIWIASPEVTVRNLAYTRKVPADRFLGHTRVICLPGITVTVREELEALERVGGRATLGLVKFKDDPTNRRIVSSWPSRFDNSYALELGFEVDEGGMDGIVRTFKDKLNAGVV